MKKVTNEELSCKIAPLIAGTLLLILFFSPIRWLFQSLQTSEYRLHSILLIVFGIGLGTNQLSKFLSFDKFEIRFAPFVIFAFGILGYVTTRKLFSIDILSCVFFGVTIYGFTGFIFDEKKWERSAIVMLLFFACLPLSYHIETFLGFPLRILSAKFSSVFFSFIGNQVHSTETILQIENKLAHIDLPCSGIKCLWSITLFSLILSFIEKYKINPPWFFTIISSWV